jgi:tRNA(Arg) A34 adenosine deaminase TadA
MRLKLIKDLNLILKQQIEAGVFDHSVQIQSGVQEKECAEMLSRFFKNRRKEKSY